MALPPVMAGAVQLTVAEALPATAVPMVGAPGTVIPVPLSATLAGEPAALEAMLSVALCKPTIVGLNCVVMTHDPAGATVVQVLAVMLNWLAPAPVNVTPDTMSGTLPVLVTVTVCVAVVVPVAAEPKLNDAVDNDAAGVATGVAGTAKLWKALQALVTASVPVQNRR